MRAELIDVMGDDDRVADCARVSFSKVASNFKPEQNARLIRFLVREGHIAPFNHPHLTFRMQAPLPIRTQCFKHKIGLTENEESRRYIKTRPELFVPAHFRAKPEGSIKQGSGGTHHASVHWKRRYIDQCETAIDLYEKMVEDGVAPEQARFVLPQGVEVHWIWTGSLSAFARFVNLRNAPDAQGEIRDLALQVSALIEGCGRFPVSWPALTQKPKLPSLAEWLRQTWLILIANKGNK